MNRLIELHELRPMYNTEHLFHNMLHVKPMIISHSHSYKYTLFCFKDAQVSQDLCLLFVCSKSLCAFNVIISSLLTLIRILLFVFISTSVLNVCKEKKNSLLFDESCLVPTQVCLVSDGKLRHCQRRSSEIWKLKSTNSGLNIWRWWETAQQLLRAASLDRFYLFCFVIRFCEHTV